MPHLQFWGKDHQKILVWQLVARIGSGMMLLLIGTGCPSCGWGEEREQFGITVVREEWVWKKSKFLLVLVLEVHRLEMAFSLKLCNLSVLSLDNAQSESSANLRSWQDGSWRSCGVSVRRRVVPAVKTGQKFLVRPEHLALCLFEQ